MGEREQILADFVYTLGRLPIYLKANTETNNHLPVHLRAI